MLTTKKQSNDKKNVKFTKWISSSYAQIAANPRVLWISLTWFPRRFQTSFHIDGKEKTVGENGI